MASNADWSLAYAQQAMADLKSYELLKSLPAPECHRMQFLQMACEKLCKAYLCRGGATPGSLMSHAYIAGTLPVVLNKTYALLQPDRENVHGLHIQITYLAREIEVLAPAVRRSANMDRSDNCEYPWEDAVGNVKVPRDWGFQATHMLESKHGRNFMKLVDNALRRLLS